MSRLYCLLPTDQGRTVHLSKPGFQPGSKARSDLVGSMCGACIVHSTRQPVPISEAFAEIGFPLRWCGPCIGRAVAHYGLSATVMALVYTAETGEVLA